MKTWQAALGWAIVGLVCLPAMGQAKGEDEAALRKQALALNEITGRLPLKGQVQTLIDNPQQTKKLLAVASRMAEDKRQPFNYNATLILASAAAQLEQADTAEKFYRLHAKQAIDLVSVQGVVAAYEGL